MDTAHRGRRGRAGSRRGGLAAGLAALLAAALLSACQTAGPQAAAVGGSNQQLAGLIRAPLALEVTMPDGSHETLEAFVTRPNAPGRFPIALITHGTSEGALNRALTANRYSTPAIAFADRGYAAVVVLRRGYGQSTGRDQHIGVSCDEPDHERAGEVARTDLIAALDALRREPWASPDKAVLLGASTGGLAVLAAAAANPPGVQAVLDFSGGRGAAEQMVCGEDSLVQAAAAYGRTSHTPTLWVYAENDKEFPPKVAKEMYDQYHASGGPGEFVMTAASGDNGHFILNVNSATLWWPKVNAFLAAQGLPSEATVTQPDVALEAPPGLSKKGKESFARYLASRNYEKAFATDGHEQWAWNSSYRTQQEAAQGVVTLCRLSAPACSLYAIGDRLVPAAAP